MLIRQIGGQKTLFLFTNSQFIKKIKAESDIEVVVGSKEMYEKFKDQIAHTLHPKVKYIF